MKKTILHTLLALLLVIAATTTPFLLVSCYDNLADSFSLKPLYLNARAEEPTRSAEIQTRAASNIQGSNFDANETIVAYIQDTDHNPIQDGTGAAHWPAFFITSSPDATTHLNILTHSPQLYYPTEDKHISITAYYPSTVTNTQTTFTVDADQTGTDGDNKYKASDLMFANIADQARTTGRVNLNFKHKMVKFLVNVVPDGDIDIGDVYLTGVNNSIAFDPATGEVTNPTGNVDIKLDNGGAVVIPPQVLTGEFIAVHGTARKEGQPTITEPARFSLKYDVGSGGSLTTRTLESGKVYTVNISVGYDNFGKTYEIGQWNDNAGVITVATYGSAGFSIVNSSIYADDDYTHDADSYDYTGSEIRVKPTVIYGATKVLTLGTDYDLQYFNNVHVGKATVLAIGKNAYEGYAVAASFNINQIPSSLQYTEIDGTTDKTALSVEYVRNYTINPTAETPKDIHLNINGNGTMSYTISRVSGDTTTDVDKVATIDATGVISVKGTGTVLVTANMADDKDYLSSSDSFTLTVTPRSYSEDEGGIRAYFVKGDETVDLDYVPSFTYDGKEHKPAIIVEDKVGDTWYDITSSCTITYPDGGINVNGTARAQIVLNAPYSGTIIKTYEIVKATPNLRLYEAEVSAANLLAPQTLELYLASLCTGNNTTCSRTRVAVTDFGTATFRIKPNTGTNSIFAVTESSVHGATNTTSGYDKNTTGVFKATGTATGTVTYQAYVAGTDNYNEAIKEFTVNVVTGYTEYAYTGYTQRWECPADGEYLLEVWGAQGGWTNSPSGADFYRGGPGAKVQGKIKLKKGEKLFVNVGQAGITVTKNFNNFSGGVDYDAYDDPQVNYANSPYLPWRTTAIASSEVPPQKGDVGMETETNDQKIIKVGFAWNGGGGQVWGLAHHNTYSPSNGSRGHFWDVRDPLSGGGGATDISLGWKDYNASTPTAAANKKWDTAEHLLTRIIVAGGGSGACYYSNERGAKEGVSGGGGDITYNMMAGYGSVYSSTNTDAGQGGRLDRGGYGAVHGTGGYDAVDVARGWASATSTRNTGRNTYTTPHNAQPTGWSGTDGIFGEGGWYYCVEEGNGAGGGGWYGGGSAGQSGANGVGGGGSSYVWCTTLETYYPTAASLWNIGKNYTPTTYSGTGHVSADDRHYYKIYKNSTVTTPKQNSYRYLYDCSSTPNANSGDSSHSVDGYAHITCLSTVNKVDLGTRTYSPSN